MPSSSTAAAGGTAQAQFDEALGLHQSGDLAAAQAAYQRLLEANPEYVDAMTNLAILYLQQGLFEEAVRLAETSLALDAEQPNAYYIKGNALRQLNRFAEALTSYEEAIVRAPEVANYFADRGEVLFFLNRLDEALTSYEAAIALDADNPQYYCDRGVVFFYLRRFEEALAYFDCALALNPDFADAHNNRGNALRSLRRFEEALASYKRALELEPESSDSCANHGNILRDLGQFEEAVAAYDRAIELNPNNAEAHSNRGVTLVGMQRFDDAVAAYDRAIALHPGHGGAYWNRALLHLLRGEYEKGWRLYEWRWKSANFAPLVRNFTQPLWLGMGSLTGKTIFIHLEQGAGDFIQFARYIPMLEARGAKVILETFPELVAVMQTLSPTVTVIARGTTPPAFDFHCPLMSLPLAFETTLETLPATVPYLRADPVKKAAWEKKLGPKTALRVGLVWSGTRRHGNDHLRSIPLALLKPLFRFPVEFHALQREVRTEDQAVLPWLSHLTLHAADTLADFSDTAALIDQMDLVISVDTSVAHLAGAMGKPLWVLVPYAPDFRWMLDREDSPWYPTAKLFRQQKFGDWEEVIGRVYRALGQHANIHG